MAMGQSEAVIRGRTNNIMAKRNRTQRKTTINKMLHRKLSNTKNGVEFRYIGRVRQFLHHKWNRFVTLVTDPMIHVSNIHIVINLKQ
jgi:hypothetical protein